MIEAGLEVDAVDSEIDIAPGREVPPLPMLAIFRPCHLKPGDGDDRQARGVWTQQSRECLPEITCRDALEVEPSTASKTDHTESRTQDVKSLSSRTPSFKDLKNH